MRADEFVPLKLRFTPNRSKCWVNAWTWASASNFFGMRVVMTTVAPIELPGYSGGKRAVDDIGAFDVIGENHRPARREGERVAEEIAEQQAIGIDQTARRLRIARAAHGDGRIHIADKTLAHRHVRHVLQHILGRHHVPVLRLFRRDRGDRGGEIGIERRTGRKRSLSLLRRRGRAAWYRHRGFRAWFRVVFPSSSGGRGKCERRRHQGKRQTRVTMKRERARTHHGTAA